MPRWLKEILLEDQQFIGIVRLSYSMFIPTKKYVIVTGLDAILYEEYVRFIGVRNSNPSEFTTAVISAHFSYFPCRVTVSPF